MGRRPLFNLDFAFGAGAMSAAILPTPLFLESDEIKSLTGYKLPARQAEWLVRNGWIFETDRRGHPKVSRSFFDARMSGHTLPGRRLGPRTDFFFR